MQRWRKKLRHAPLIILNNVNEAQSLIVYSHSIVAGGFEEMS